MKPVMVIGLHMAKGCLESPLSRSLNEPEFDDEEL